MTTAREKDLLDKANIDPNVGVPAAKKDEPLVWLPGAKRKRKVLRQLNKGMQPGGHNSYEWAGEGGRVHGYPQQPGTYLREWEPVTVERTEVEKLPDSTATRESVGAWIYDPSRRQQIVKYLQTHGYDVARMSFDQIEETWLKAVDRASNAYMASGRRVQVSPWDMLDLTAPIQEGAKQPPKGKVWTETSTATDVAEIPPEQARSILTEALQRALGRAPTEEELDDFASRANAMALSNPQVTTTTERHEWDPELEQYKTVDTKRKASGGVTADMLTGAADQNARRNPEFDVAQAANFYGPALMQALDSPVAGGTGG